MPRPTWITGCVAGALMVVGVLRAAEPESPATRKDDPSPAAGLVLTGKTQPVPGKAAIIAPKVLDNVEVVLVKVGDRVKKDQALVKLTSDGEEADLEAKKAALAELQASLARLKEEPREQDIKEAEAALATARICTEEARHYFERLEPLWKRGALAEQRLHEARATLSKCEADEKAATARLERLKRRPFDREVAELQARVATAAANIKVAEATLGDHTVTAAIDGVVSRIDVRPGEVARPGTTIWGEILDLSEIDVRCELTPDQADRAAVGQPAEVFIGNQREPWTGRVVLIGIAADPRTGRLPLIVRIADAKERIRCYVDAKVRLLPAASAER